MESQNLLSSSQIYPYLHQFLVGLGASRPGGLNSQGVFAEVFSVCRKAAIDPTSGENLKTRYFDDLQERTGNHRLTELILCMTWVVLTVQEQPSYTVSTFTQRLQPLIRHSAYFNKARQLAVTIRQHERHIQTDFLATLNAYPDMKVQIEGNPGTGNSYTDIHDNHIETLAPNATIR